MRDGRRCVPTSLPKILGADGPRRVRRAVRRTHSSSYEGGVSSIPRLLLLSAGLMLAEFSASPQVGDHLVGQNVGRFLPRRQVQLGFQRGFVWVVDAREAFDLPGAGLLVQPFRVTALTDFERSVDEDLDEIAGGQSGPNGVAIAAIGANEGGER